MPAALLLAVLTAPPVLPRGVVTQLAESAVLAGLGLWAGRAWRGAPPGPVLVVATAVWAALTLGGQDARRVALGMAPVGWVPLVVAATVVVLVAGRGGRRVVTAGGVVLALAVTAAVVPAGASPPSRPSPPAEVVPAVRPVHVGVGLGPGTPAERADAAVRALAAAGGLARRTLVVVVPTGSGWVDPAALATLEAATGGDVATVALAYDDAPSWVSYLTAREDAVATTGALLAAVARARPPGTRVLVHGQSLGALAGARAWARHPEQADGAFWVGPPADTPTAPAAPGRPVEALAHPTDPAAIWSPRLLVVPPDRPLPVPWLPVVSFVQTSVDLLGAVGAPAGRAPLRRRAARGVDAPVGGHPVRSAHRVPPGTEAGEAGPPAQLLLGTGGVHDRRVGRRRDPLQRQGQRQRHRRAGRHLGHLGGQLQHPGAELARELGQGDDAVAGDVVRPGRAVAERAPQQRRADVVVVDELQREGRHGQRQPQARVRRGRRDEPAAEGGERAGQRQLGALEVGAPTPLGRTTCTSTSGWCADSSASSCSLRALSRA